jgi:hypothetical protein
MQMLLDVFAQILRTLWAHKLRSFLTMFGIAWSVSAKASEPATSAAFPNTAKTS